MRRLAASVATAMFAASPVFAQTPPAQAPPPQPPVSQPATPPRAPTTTGAPSAPMPVQKQALEYFAGSWAFKWTGAENPLGPSLYSGTLAFMPRDAARGLEGVTDATSADGAYHATAAVQFDADKKIVIWSEARPNGVKFVATGDWTSPLAIRFAPVTIAVQGKSYRLKRTLSIISAGSFTVVDEIAAGDGPFARLGNGVFTKGK